MFSRNLIKRFSFSTNPSPTVESDPKPKLDPFVASIGSPESVGKERCLVSGGARGG